MVYTIGMIVQGILIVVNSALILYNYWHYKRDPTFKRARIALIIASVLMLIWSTGWLIFEAGKVSGNW